MNELEGEYIPCSVARRDKSGRRGGSASEKSAYDSPVSKAARDAQVQIDLMNSSLIQLTPCIRPQDEPRLLG